MPSELDQLSSDDYPKQIAARADCASAEPALAGADGPGETTHLCVADAAGNVVSLTQSIQSLLGAVNEKLGFLYNNYLHTCPRWPHPSQLGSLVRPRSNAAPILVLRAAAASCPRFSRLSAA